MSNLRAASWLLRDVTIPSLRHHRVRTILTLVGVVIGTQVVVAIALMNRSILASFEHTVETIAGGADLQVSNGSAGVPDELAASLGSAPGVTSAAGLIQGVLTTDWGDLTVFGVDLFGDQSIRQMQFPKAHVHIDDGLRFANAPDSIAISTSFATRAGLALDAQFAVGGPTGKSTLTVRGVLDPIGPAALFGGAVGLVDLPTAQRLFDRPDRVDQIDVALRDDAEPVAMIEVLTALVHGAGIVEQPRERGARLGSMLSAVQTVLTLLSLFAVIVGAFIIYHTMETAIAQRKREFAFVRAVGYRRRAVLTAIGIEALAYGIVGSLVGIVLGIGGARVSLGLVTTGVGAIWTRVDSVRLAFAARDFLTALGLGVGSTLAAALAPAREAARLRVVEQLQDDPESPESGWDWPGAIRGLALAVGGYLLLNSGIRPEGFNAKIALIMAGIVLIAVGYAYLAPFVVRGVIAVTRALTGRLRPAAPALATENIGRDPRKSRGVLAALMAAFAMVLIVNAFVRSLRGSLLSWVDQTLSADLHVSPGMALPLPSGPTLSGAVEHELTAIPGVADVSASRMINIRVGDGLAVLRTVSVGGLRRQHYPVVDGDVAGSLERFARGEAVLVSDNLAYRHGLQAGQPLVLDTPSGQRAFTIGAVVNDYTLDIGTVIIERQIYTKLWRDGLANEFLLWLRPGNDREAIRAAISQRLGQQQPVTVLTGREFNAQISHALDEALLLTHAIQLVAITIALIGVVNFFLAEIVARRREIGLLRSVALSRRQIVQLLGAEAAIIGALGGLMAALYAWPVARLLVTRSTRLVSGWALTFEFSLGVAVSTIAVAALTSMIAAYYPARQAATERVADLIVVE